MFYIALAMYALVVSMYILFSIALLYHVNRYMLGGGPGPLVARIYIIFSVIALLASAYYFFQVPWDMMNLA